MKFKVLTIACLSLLLAAPAFAYEVIEVADGGTLKGKITTAATASEGTIPGTKDESVCHSSVPDQTVVVGEGGGLANGTIIESLS